VRIERSRNSKRRRGLLRRGLFKRKKGRVRELFHDQGHLRLLAILEI
jgi:hypothetical protein